MESVFALIGFGEAAAALGSAGQRAYDIKTDDPASRAAKLSDYRAHQIIGCDSFAAALCGATIILSLVTADQALRAARNGAAHLEQGALWIDMNSVAPSTKEAASRVIESAGGRYVDAAVMAPVNPAGHAVPILLSGPHAEVARILLAGAGFTKVETVDGAVGAAASIKMIRSVLVKGIEALTAECAIAAEAAGVSAEVFASLDASWRADQSWKERTTYNLDRMMRHGGRRSAEMDEVVKALDALDVASEMSRATSATQRRIGKFSKDAQWGSAAAIDSILGRRKDRAA